ncbi:MAG: dapL, partial [Actinomycetia bacterium]|nr:dapL [Actinomycetes bacterium]
MTEGFVPPQYPFDKLAPLQAICEQHDGGMVDLSVGTPVDPPPAFVLEALATSGAERGYPASIGSLELRTAASGWFGRRLGVDIGPKQIAACIGTKELVAGLPHWLKLRTPDRDTVLYPAVSYPTYEMGAILAGCRAVPVPVDHQWRLDLSQIDPADAARALCLWSNTPGNPAGGLDDLAAVAAWGRDHGVPVLSDECYVEFTWAGPRQTVLQTGIDGEL